jgi:hypothetical protein
MGVFLKELPRPSRVDRKSKPYGLVAEWFGLEIWKRVLSSLI